MNENANKRRQSFNETNDYIEVYDKTAALCKYFRLPTSTKSYKIIKFKQIYTDFCSGILDTVDCLKQLDTV